jgi:hypothetical protein
MHTSECSYRESTAFQMLLYVTRSQPGLTLVLPHW